jgi:hypothetical protein
MVARQREMGKEGGVVLDGRDIGTAVFPDAEVKFFLDADPAERARRRLGELRAAGSDVSFDAIEKEVRERDYTDTHRAESPLQRAWDAIALDTTALGHEEVVERMLAAVRAREGRPADLARLAAAHLRSGRSYLEVLRTAQLSCGLYRLRRGEEDQQRPHARRRLSQMEGRARFRMGDQDFQGRARLAADGPRPRRARLPRVTEDPLPPAPFAPAEGTAEERDRRSPRRRDRPGEHASHPRVPAFVAPLHLVASPACSWRDSATR